MSRYCMLYFGYTPIKGFRCLELIIYKKLTSKILFIVIISWTIIWHFRKKKKNCGHQTYYLAGGPKLSTPPQISRIFQFKNLRSVIFVIYIIPHFLHDVILLYKRKKEKEKNVISAHPGIDPGPLVPKSDMLSTRPRCQVVRVSK